MALKITASVRAATRLDSTTGVYIAYCPTLQLFSQGTDQKRARLAMESAIMLFLSGCIKNGVLDQALQERGFTTATAQDSRSPEELNKEFIAVENYDQTFELDVPLYLLNAKEKESMTC